MPPTTAAQWQRKTTVATQRCSGDSMLGRNPAPFRNPLPHKPHKPQQSDLSHAVAAAATHIEHLLGRH